MVRVTRTTRPLSEAASDKAIAGLITAISGGVTDIRPSRAGDTFPWQRIGRPEGAVGRALPIWAAVRAAVTRGTCQSRPARVLAIRATGQKPVGRLPRRPPEGVGTRTVRLRPAREEAGSGPTPVAVQPVRRARAVSAARAVKEERGQPGPRREHTGAPVTLLPRIPPASPAAIRRVGSGRSEAPAMGSRADHRPSVPRPPSLTATAS